MPIPDFSTAELKRVRGILKARYHGDVEIHVADCEMSLRGQADEVTEYSALFWRALVVNFVIVRSAQDAFRYQYFYTPDEPYGTGHPEYNELTECVGAVLQVESDHAREKEGVRSGTSGEIFLDHRKTSIGLPPKPYTPTIYILRNKE